MKHLILQKSSQTAAFVILRLSAGATHSRDELETTALFFLVPLSGNQLFLSLFGVLHVVRDFVAFLENASGLAVVHLSVLFPF